MKLTFLFEALKPIHVFGTFFFFFWGGRKDESWGSDIPSKAQLSVILEHWLKETGFAVAAVRVKASVVHNIWSVA